MNHVKRMLAVTLAIGAFALLACSETEADAEPTATGMAPPEAGTAVASPTAPAATATATATSVAQPPATSTAVATPEAGAAASEAAREALAGWLGPVGDPASIVVQSVEPVTWPDGCLGLARAGSACTQAEVEGYRVMLGLGAASYEVRTNANGGLTLWAPEVEVLALFSEAGPNVLEFTTDDGAALVTQAVFGTDYGVDVGSLEQGDPVGLGLARGPQSGPMLLVWLDPVTDPQGG